MVSVSGWVMEQLGRVPETGDEFTCANANGTLHVQVTRVDGHRADEIRVTVTAPAETTAEE